MKTPLIDLDDPLYAVALRVVRLNIGPCATAALLLLAANIGAGYLAAPLAFAILRALLLMMAGYAAYRTLTSGGRISGWRAIANGAGRIPWRYGAVMLMILSPILVLGIVWNAPGSGVGPDGLEGIAFGVAMVITYGLLYVFLGTALPEVAESGDTMLAEAIQRGRSHYRPIGRALVFGPWLFRAAALALLIGLYFLGVPTDFRGPMGSINPAGLGPMLLLTSAHVFAEVLTAVVLTRAWRRYRVLPEEKEALAA